jgi:hypothetical protein
MAPYLQATGHTWVIGVSMPPALTGTSTKEKRKFWIQWTKANDTIIGTILAKLPTSMDFVAQMIIQEKNNAGKANDPTITGIHTAVVLSWDQQLIQGKGKAPTQANKLSAVKPKGSDPKFQQQQQPQKEAGSSGLGPNGTPW